jgi:hypothetical protein
MLEAEGVSREAMVTPDRCRASRTKGRPATLACFEGNVFSLER